ncbi:MAG: hypothetical protein IPM81_22785 [Saprospirales bacterium]|nr:hypothetical protein [Saprospirales bacterium]
MIDPPWGFPESISLPGVMASQTDQDFYGIKTGDVVATWANPAALWDPGEPMACGYKTSRWRRARTIGLEFRIGQLADLASFSSLCASMRPPFFWKSGRSGLCR